jgi:hypothetical protein
MVGGFHVAGVVSRRFEAMSVALHSVGTVALGAGIALAGQIFNLAEHWPAAIMLWALGAALAWALLRHWTQGALTAILVPYWLAAEASLRIAGSHPYAVGTVATGICALSLTYLSARRGASDSALRKSITWIGGVALLPAAFFTAAGPAMWKSQTDVWAVAILGPMVLALMLHGRQAAWNGAAIAWTVVLAALAEPGERIGIYAWCALGAVGLVAWGIREARPERINLGSAGFALAVQCFYFSNVMDKLGRSASLIVLGVLFLGGGWALERTRRRLIGQIRSEAI